MMFLHAANGPRKLIAGFRVLMPVYFVHANRPVVLTAHKFRNRNEAAMDSSISIITSIRMFMNLRVIAGQHPHFAIAIGSVKMSFIHGFSGFRIVFRLPFFLPASQFQSDRIAGVRMVMARHGTQTAYETSILIVAIAVMLMIIYVLGHAAQRVPLAVKAIRGMNMDLKIGSKITFLDNFGNGFRQTAHQRLNKARIGMLMLLETAGRFFFRFRNRLYSSDRHHHQGRQKSESPADDFAYFIPIHVGPPSEQVLLFLYLHC